MLEPIHFVEESREPEKKEKKIPSPANLKESHVAQAKTPKNLETKRGGSVCLRPQLSPETSLGKLAQI